MSGYLPKKLRIDWHRPDSNGRPSACWTDVIANYTTTALGIQEPKANSGPAIACASGPVNKFKQQVSDSRSHIPSNTFMVLDYIKKEAYEAAPS